MKRRTFLKTASLGIAGSAVMANTAGKLLAGETVADTNARYVWYDNSGQGRNLYAQFRKSFMLTGTATRAELHVFADTSYQLFINGEFIEFGPVRFDPRFPQYDTHDLTPHLKRGRNVIAVEVNYFGHKTYKSMLSNAGFIAWGEIADAAGTVIPLATGQVEWKCRPSDEHIRYASKTSFALNAADQFSQVYSGQGWKAVDFDDRNWQPAVQLTRQDYWGELAPRSIPFMTGKDVPVGRIMGIYPLYKTEDWYSFTLPLPHYFEDNARDFSNFLAFKTWIYSPVDQEILPGVFWGESWLNGEALERGAECVDKSMRIQQRWKLKKGWNYFFGKVGAYFDALHHYLALPKDRGLVVAADKKMNSQYSFYRLPLLKAEQYDTWLKNKPLPFAAEDSLTEVGGWLKVPKTDTAYDPCRETSWDEYGEPFETLKTDQLNGHVFRKAEYTDGFAVLIDMGYIHLVFPRLQLQGVRDAVVDVTGEEHMNPDNMHITQSHHYHIGDRITCTQDTLDWFPTHPRGVRYLKITVRNTSGDVTLKSLSLRSANYPVEAMGSFSCSEPLLNEIWQMGQRTQATNMEDVYVDCVGRERGMYGRDTIIQYHVNMATFGDQALMRRCMELFGQSPDATGKFRAVYPNTGDYTIADFALNMVEGYRNYYDYSGDATLITEYWDAIMKNLAWFDELADERDDLLLDSEWDKKRNVKSIYGGFHGDGGVVRGHMSNTGIHCVFSCNYLLALQCAVVLAKVIGKMDDCGRMQKRVDILSKSIAEKFWDDDKKCFADNLQKSAHSIQANLFPIRAGIVTADRLEYVKKHVAWELRSLFINGYDPSRGVLTSPSYAFYILDGLYLAGLIDTAENLMKQGWGWGLAQGLKTCMEHFGLGGSQCHAWSASPTWYLSKYVLGVQFPKAPDLSYVELNVQTHSVDKAEGKYPHPLGDIYIKWHKDNGRIVFDKVEAPAGVTVKIKS